tara:strand:+ start:435 stop:605 length:171 start_codon:yes stop_codon:yes gene_type:complete
MAYLQSKVINKLGLGTLKKLRAEAKKNAEELSSNIKSPKFRSTEKIMKYKKQKYYG